jgi:hypothetical protein
MTESVLATALAFANHGHAVFPVNWPVSHNGKNLCSCGSDGRGRPCTKPAKHPYGKLATNGVLSATTDTGIIKTWFGYQAREANLGVHCEGLVVLDVDPRRGGDESLAALEREHGELPLTWRVLTGGGGEHILFSAPEGIAIGNVAEQMANSPLGKGIDIRARGGYIVAPPSRHISGRQYAWSVDHHPKDVPLAPAPEWLIAKLTATTSSAAATGGEKLPHDADFWAQFTQQKVAEYADLAAARITGHLFRHNVDFQLVRGLIHAWNAACCASPLTYAELDRIVDRIADKEAARIERELGR